MLLGWPHRREPGRQTHCRTNDLASRASSFVSLPPTSVWVSRRSSHRRRVQVTRCREQSSSAAQRPPCRSEHRAVAGSREPRSGSVKVELCDFGCHSCRGIRQGIVGIISVSECVRKRIASEVTRPQKFPCSLHETHRCREVQTRLIRAKRGSGPIGIERPSGWAEYSFAG